MYRTIRWIHGQLALLLALAVFGYATSGWFIQYGRLFFPDTPTLNESHAVAGLAAEEMPNDAEGRAVLAHRFAEELEIPGRLRDVKAHEAGLRARFASASRRTQVTWQPGSDRVELEIRPASFGPSFTTLHRVHGPHGGAAFVGFAVLVDLVALAMIVYAVTGVFLWWKLKRKKTLGLVTLGASSLFTLAWMARLAWGP